MKKAVVSILQVVGYFILFLAITIALMGLTKMFIGEWESGGELLDVFWEGVFTTIVTVAVLVLLGVRNRRRGILDLPLPLGKHGEPNPYE